MFREAAQLLKQFIMFRTYVSTPPHVNIVLFTSMEEPGEKKGHLVGVYSLKKVKPVGGVGRRNRGYKGGIGGIICPG